jgi:hypothetical protein
MDKKKLIEYLGGTCKAAAEKLDYKSANARCNIQRLSDPLTPRQVQTITMRMKAKRIKIPESLSE